MRAGSRLIAAALTTVAVVAVAGWRADTRQVQHATVQVGNVGPNETPLVVELWRDTVDGELALRLRGDSDVSVLRGRTLAGTIDGQLATVETYLTAAVAWRIVRLRFGVTATQAVAALAAGDAVDRPSLLDLPKPDGSTTFSRDFGTDIGKLRRAARFHVPSPGRRLAGLALAHAALVRTGGPGLGFDSGYIGGIIYSSTPTRVGTGGRELLLNAASPRIGAGAEYASGFASSRDRIVGPGYEARIWLDDVILRYHSTYVLVRPSWSASNDQLRSILSRIARS